MLTVAEVGAWMDARLTRSAFRLELLSAYDVATDGEDVARYLAGEPEPDTSRKEPWLEELRKERAAGIRRYRVHCAALGLVDDVDLLPSRRIRDVAPFALVPKVGRQRGSQDIAAHDAAMGAADPFAT